MKVSNNENFVANGIVVKNCDALRYAIVSAFPRGEFSSPDEHLTVEQLKRKIYGESEFMGFGDNGLGYM